MEPGGEGNLFVLDQRGQQDHRDIHLARQNAARRAVSQTNVNARGRIGNPQQVQVSAGHALWMIDGDKLILVRTFTTGSVKPEFTFSGSGSAMTCSLRSPLVREEGAGNIRHELHPCAAD